MKTMKSMIFLLLYFLIFFVTSPPLQLIVNLSLLSRLDQLKTFDATVHKRDLLNPLN